MNEKSNYPEILTDGWYKKLSKKIDVETEVLKVVVKAYGDVTKMLNRKFDSDWFFHHTNEHVSDYESAAFIDKKKAMYSSAWGVAGIMGHDHKKAGYVSVEVMVMLFEQSMVEQLVGLTNWIASNKRLHKALKDKDWAKVDYNSKGIGFSNKSSELSELYKQLIIKTEKNG